MTFFENDTPFFVPFAENLPSLGLAPPYAASPTETGTAENAAAAAAALTELEMSEEAETTISRKMNSADEEGLVFRMPHLLGNTEGGMMSPPWVHFSFEEAWSLRPNFNAGMGMGGGTSPTRMNYFPPPSGDSIGNSNPFTLAGGMMPSSPTMTKYSVPSGVSHLLKRFVSEKIKRPLLGNEEQIIITMTLNVKLKQACFLVKEKITDSCIPQVNWRMGMKMERISVTRQWSVIIVVVLNNDRSSSSSSVNRKMSPLIHLERNLREMSYLLSLERQFLDQFEKGVAELLSGEEIKLQYLQEGEVGTASQKNHSVSILPPLLEAECRMMQLFVSPSTFKRPRRKFGITRGSLEEVGTASEENHTAQYNAAAGREGMLLRQEDSSPEPHIPEPNATNEERNNVVELNNSIDAKGGNSSSEKTGTISRWEKDHGITCQVPEPLFGKSRADAAETLKGRGGMLLQQEGSSSEPHIPKSSATNEETNNVVVVELNNSIDDAKGGNSSSEKTHTISRWEKDHGITRQVPEPLFGKSRNAAAETLKGRGGMLLRQEDSSSEPHIPEPSATNEVGTASEENHTAHIWPAQYNAAGSGGMLLQQKDSSSEPHIPESSPTNEETNNVVVVELNNTNSIDDAKGGKSSSEKTHTICRWEKDYGITHQALQRLFGKSRDDAAKTFGVSTSTLKRACRDFGINRWPNHKGKRPNNCSVNQQHVQAVKKHKGIQPSLALPPEEATTTTLQGNSVMSVKATYEDNTIRFPLPSSSTLKYLEEQLETRFKICLENFSIMYQDEEADWISLTCDSDLVYGMDVLRSSGKTVVKMKIKPNFG